DPAGRRRVTYRRRPAAPHSSPRNRTMTRTIDDTPFALPEQVADLFREAIGAEHVHTATEQRDEYRDPYWYQEDRTYDSSAVLYPASTEQVQAVVRIANEHGVPLWTSSQGRNYGYGGPSPRVK